MLQGIRRAPRQRTPGGMSEALDTAEAGEAANRTLTARMLDRVERAGNKMPNPAILFLWLCVLIIALSQVLFWLNVHATYEAITLIGRHRRQPAVRNDRCRVHASDLVHPDGGVIVLGATFGAVWQKRARGAGDTAAQRGRE